MALTAANARDQHLDHRQRPGRDGLATARSRSTRRSTSWRPSRRRSSSSPRSSRSMSLLVAERERGTLAWVASKPVSRRRDLAVQVGSPRRSSCRSSPGSSRWRRPSASSAVLYGSAGIGAVRFAGDRGRGLGRVHGRRRPGGLDRHREPGRRRGDRVRGVLPPADRSRASCRSTSRRSCRPRSWPGPIGLVVGAEVGFVTPIAWAVSVIALVGSRHRGGWTAWSSDVDAVTVPAPGEHARRALLVAVGPSRNVRRAPPAPGGFPRWHTRRSVGTGRSRTGR